MSSKSPRPQATPAAFSMDDFARALEEHDYQFQSGQVVRGKIFNYESTGVFVDIGGKSLAFLPADEVALGRVVDISALLPLQSEHDFLIIRDQDADGQVTLSRKRLEMKRVWERLGELQASSQTVNATVTGLNKGGVTVDVQGLRGFIPRSHLSERDNLESLKGQTFTVGFLEVDPNRNKLVVSQRLAARAASMTQFETGQLIEGKVVGLKPFGVFVEFNGATGLLHINQISKNYISDLHALFQMGQPLKAVITELDESRGRISLSTKLLENFPGEMVEQQDVVMAEAADRMEKVKKTFTQSADSQG